MMTADSKTELFSSGDAAEELGVPPYTLQYLLSTGTLPEPDLRVAGKRAWRYSEIQEARRIMKEKTSEGEN